MANREQFPAIFARLKQNFQPFVPPLRVHADTPENYEIVGDPTAKYPEGFYVGGVRVGKSYVSYHLMAVYMFPDLLTGISERLKKRVQGKSCFNFTTLDEATAQELAHLTAAGFERYRQAQAAQRI